MKNHDHRTTDNLSLLDFGSHLDVYHSRCLASLRRIAMPRYGAFADRREDKSWT